MSKRASMRLWLGVVILACLGLYLIGNNSVPLWDRDEPWYAQCSWQMLRSGDWIVPRYLDGSLRTQKPPLIYWLHMIPMSVLGPTPFAARLVSTIGMTAVLTLLGIVLFRTVGPQRAVWTVLILGTSGLAIAAAKMCLTDAVLLLWICIVQLCLLAIYRGRGSWPLVLLMLVAIGLGMLTKGPIALVPPATTGLVLLIMEAPGALRRGVWHSSRFWHNVTVVAVVLLAVAGASLAALTPWAIGLHTREPQFLPRILNALILHVGTSTNGHSGPPGYYLALVWGTFFPWSLLIPTAVTLAWKHRRLPIIRFAAAAIVGPWVFQEIMQTKLPHYVLPAYPFLALLTADALVRCIRGQYPDLSRRAFVIAVGIWAVLIGLLGSAPWVMALPRFNFHPQPWAAMIVLSVVGFLFTGSVFYFFRARKLGYAAGCMGGGMILFVALGYGWYLPNAPFLGASAHAADLLKQNNVAAEGDVVSVDYSEPSLPFYHGGSVRMAPSPTYLTQTPPGQWAPWLVLSGEAFAGLSPELQSRLEVLGSFRGYNYAGDMVRLDGKKTRFFELLVARKRPAPAAQLVTASPTTVPTTAPTLVEPATRPTTEVAGSP